MGGTFAGDILSNNIKVLSFFKTVYHIGTSAPFIVNLKIMKLTFGINFDINIMTIVGVILAMYLYRKY
nr:DUF4321 domain-containing protein [Clostridium aestuarii]